MEFRSFIYKYLSQQAPALNSEEEQSLLEFTRQHDMDTRVDGLAEREESTEVTEVDELTHDAPSLTPKSKQADGAAFFIHSGEIGSNAEPVELKPVFGSPANPVATQPVSSDFPAVADALKSQPETADPASATSTVTAGASLSSPETSGTAASVPAQLRGESGATADAKSVSQATFEAAEATGMPRTMGFVLDSQPTSIIPQQLQEADVNDVQTSKTAETRPAIPDILISPNADAAHHESASGSAASAGLRIEGTTESADAAAVVHSESRTATADLPGRSPGKSTSALSPIFLKTPNASAVRRDVSAGRVATENNRHESEQVHVDGTDNRTTTTIVPMELINSFEDMITEVESVIPPELAKIEIVTGSYVPDLPPMPDISALLAKQSKFMKQSTADIMNWSRQ